MPITEYIWDPVTDAYLMEKDGAGNTTAVYTQEPVPYGNLISQRRDGQTYQALQDGLGSIRQLTDETGAVTDSYTYTAFGETVSPPGPTVNPFRWLGNVGYYHDDATGSYYVRARNYAPATGRWTSTDPLMFVDGVNLYVACFIPNSSDPSGEYTPTPIPSALGAGAPRPLPGPPFAPIPAPSPGRPPGPTWRRVSFPPGYPGIVPAGCSNPLIPPPGTGLPPSVWNCSIYNTGCVAGNRLACNAYWACLNGGADPANSCVRACLQTVGFPPPSVPAPRPGSGFPATSPDCWCSYVQHLACMTACRPRAPGVVVPPWGAGGLGFNWCTFKAVCSEDLVPALNLTPWCVTAAPVGPPVTVPPPIGGPGGFCIFY